MASELREHHLTGRPVTVRPMTRRWISDVPSKIVKIFTAYPGTLIRRVYAGKPGYVSASNGLQRRGTAPNGGMVLPAVHPTGRGWRGIPVYDPAGRI